MSKPAYEIAALALERDAWRLSETDLKTVMGLLGYEVTSHGRLRFACRPFGESHWQSLPSFNDAKDAELWLRNRPGSFSHITQEESGWLAFYRWGGWHGGGESESLGAAMFAAYIRSEGPRNKSGDF
jgi:hypothetical protein